MKVALAGGGGASGSYLLDEVFAKWLGPQGKLLYWPMALRGMRPYEAGLEWITTTFEGLKISDIRMWTNLADHRAAELDAFDGVYLGGGNTFSLLAQLRESGFHNHLKHYIEDGKPVYGGSAGAVVLGQDIRTVHHLEHNDVGLTKTEGLGVAAGHAVWVHYKPQDDLRIKAFIHKYRIPVLAIPERAGIVIDEGGYRQVGFEAAYRFEGQEKLDV
jgi:dipeptidase E